MRNGTDHAGRTPACLFTLIAVAIVLLAPATGATDKCGEVGGETWNLAGSPYIVTCDVSVAAGTTLTIEAGVEVRFQLDTGMTIDGGLNVDGVASDIVTFTSDAVPPEMMDWAGVALRANSTGTITHALVECAVNGITILDDATVNLTGVTVNRNLYALRLAGEGTPTVHVADSTITGNGTGGIMVGLTAADQFSTPLTITGSEIHGNGCYPDSCYDLGVTSHIEHNPYLVMARGNWWGTDDAQEIRSHMTAGDGWEVPIVDFCDFLNGPGGTPARDVRCPDLMVDPSETESLIQTDKPYLITWDMQVRGTLVVGAGVEVRVVPGRLTQGILIYGDVIFNSTVNSPALFTSDSPADEMGGQWDGLDLYSSATIRNAILEYAYTCVQIEGPDVVVENVTARNGYYQGLMIRPRTDGSVTVTDSAFTDNGKYGVMVIGGYPSPGARISISNSSIHDNDLADFQVSDSPTPDIDVIVARNNWWGTTDTQAIQNAIHDYEDDNSLPRVDWCGHLNGEGGVPVYDMYCPDLYVCGGENVTLDETGKPYLLTSDLYVCEGSILEIAEGVEVRAAEYTPPEHIYVAGTLDVNGSVGSPVTFESNASSPQAGDWAGIHFFAGGTGDLQHAAIRHADAGVVASGASNIVLHEVDSRMNQDGLYVGGDGPPDVTATYCTFADNTRNGVTVSRMDGYANPAVTVNHSSLFNNGSYEYYADAFNDPAETRLDASQNWWGTDNTAVIAAGIYDHSDSATSPIVDWCGYLETEGGGGRDINCPATTQICGVPLAEWLLSDKPYLVTSDVYVCDGSTLTIGEGVNVLLADTGTPLEFLVEGTLITSGAELNPVTLTSDAAAPAAGDWSGVKLAGLHGHASLSHTTISHGSNGIQLADSATADLTGVTVSNNTSYGIQVTGSAAATMDGVTASYNGTGLIVDGTGPPVVMAVNSTFAYNSTYGVRVVGYPDPDVTVTHSSFHHNGSFNYHAGGFADAGNVILDATNNYWGSTDTTVIGADIYDHRTNLSSPRIDWCRYQDSGGVPVVDANCPDLVICGETQPETWNDTEKPYQVTTDLTVCAGDTLQVGPGVEVRTVKMTTYKPKFLIEGTLDVNGDPDSPAVFGSDALSPAAQDWLGVWLRGDSVSEIHDAVFKYATNGLDVRDAADVALDGVTARQNQIGLYVDGTGPPTVSAVNSAFVQNTSYGVRVYGAPDPEVTVNRSSLYSNGTYDYWASSFASADAVLDAHENWWGTTDTTLIGNRIYDHRRNAVAARVDWCRYLNGQDGAPEIDAHCPDLAVCGETAVWDLTDKPYQVTTDFWVCPSGGVLEVGPGVDVRTVKMTSYKPKFLIEGTFDVDGTVGSPAVFGSNELSPAAGDWLGVWLRGSSVSDIRNAEFNHGTYGLDVRDAADLTLHGVTLTANGTGLYVDGSGPPAVHAANSLFVQNSNYGVRVVGAPNPDVTVTRSAIHSNAGAYDFHAGAYLDPDNTSVWATDNWWGTTDTTQIASRIYDRDDSTSSPRVRIQAFGEECDLALGRDGDGDGHPDFLDNCPERSNANQADADLDGMGDACDPEPGTAPSSACDGFDDLSDGWLDADGDGWGDPCDFHPLRADSYPGAAEICDARDNDGDAVFDPGELVDADLDLGILCGDCDDLEPNANICLCEVCGSGIDDDCDLLADGADPDCVPFDACIVLETGAEPYLTMHDGVCGGATLSDPHDIIRGRVDALTFVSGSVDLGAVECVAAAHAWDRATDQSLNPNPKCDPVPLLFYLAKYATEDDYGQSSTGEWRDVMTPDPACVP